MHILDSSKERKRYHLVAVYLYYTINWLSLHQDMSTFEYNDQLH